MSALEIFDYSGQQVRTVPIDGEAWFVAVDVCIALDIANSSQAVSYLDEDERSTTLISNEGWGNPVRTVISEAGLYSLILRSRKPEAKAFKRWVTHEVLPTIRKSGQFGSRVPANFADALELAAAQQREIEAAEAKIALDAPKVAAYEALIDADGYYSMEAAGKVIGIGRNTLFRKLRDAGVLQVGSNLPYQRYMHHFKITAGTRETPNGLMPTQTVRVRPSGLEFVAHKAGMSLLVGAE